MKILLLLIIIATLFTGCANLQTTGLTDEPDIPYYIALRTFNSAWETYHRVWIQLPEDQKKVWVNKYHIYFNEATPFLDLWALDPYNPDPTYDGKTWKALKENIENLVIKAVIKNQ